MAKHFDDNGNEIRCVYLFEFSDGYCYIGTTNDEDRRIDDHLYSDRKSEVYQHKRHTGLIPTFLKLHDYTSIEESDRLEHYYTIEYAKLGRKILNVQKPGGYGHKENYHVTPRNIKGKIDRRDDPYNAEEEYDKTALCISKYRHSGAYSDSVKKVYDILIKICKRVLEEGGEFICIRRKDFPFDFNDNELSSYNIDSSSRKVRSLCAISYVYYTEEKKHLSYLKIHEIDNNFQNHDIQCQYEDNNALDKLCNEIYDKSYVFKRTETLQGYLNDNLINIDNKVTSILLNHKITAPFTQEVDIDILGYRDGMTCSKIDYSVILSKIGGFWSPSFNINYDEDWNLSAINLCVTYNAYSIWAKRYDIYEMQSQEKQTKFTKLVKKIDNFILAEKNKIFEFPKRIEILAKDLRISEIGTLLSFMRHFYVSHGTSWDTGSPDSCICSIENYNGTDMNGCKFIIDIQGEQFFDHYDLRTHTLDDSYSHLNKIMR